MHEKNYTLQDLYLEKANSESASEQCETCYSYFKPVQLIWSEATQNFSCKECISEVVKIHNVTQSEKNKKQLTEPIGVSVNFYPR